MEFNGKEGVRRAIRSRNQAAALRDTFELIKALQNTERDDVILPVNGANAQF